MIAADPSLMREVSAHTRLGGASMRTRSHTLPPARWMSETHAVLSMGRLRLSKVSAHYTSHTMMDVFSLTLTHAFIVQV